MGSEKKIYLSEDGFRVTPTKAFDEADMSEYAAVIFPGIINPLPALFDDKLISFISALKGKEILIAAISCAPLLLAKAGLLDDVKFTAGIFMQMAEAFDFIPKENFVHVPLLEDQNVITAIGFAFREFAEAVLGRLGFETGDNFLLPAKESYREQDLTYYWSDADYREFLEELEEYTQPQK